MSPEEPPTLAQVLAVLQASHDRLADTLDKLSEEQVVGPSYADEWTIAQVSSHLGSGAEVFTLFLEAGVNGAPPPGLESFRPIWAEWDAKPPTQQATDAIATDAAFLERVSSLTPDEQERWRLELFGSESGLVDLLRMRLGEHTLHTWDITVALDPTSTLPEDATALVLDNLSLLVQLAGKPTPNPITVDVRTTTPDRHLRLRLTPEGANLSAGDSGSSDAGLTLPGEAFVRLVYGRLDAAHAPSTVTARGVELDLLRNVFPGHLTLPHIGLTCDAGSLPTTSQRGCPRVATSACRSGKVAGRSGAGERCARHGRRGVPVLERGVADDFPTAACSRCTCAPPHCTSRAAAGPPEPAWRSARTCGCSASASGCWPSERKMRKPPAESAWLGTRSALADSLERVTGCVKTYLMQFSEAESPRRNVTRSLSPSAQHCNNGGTSLFRKSSGLAHIGRQPNRYAGRHIQNPEVEETVMSRQSRGPSSKSRPKLSGMVAFASILALVFGVGAAQAQQVTKVSTPPVGVDPAVTHVEGPPPVTLSNSGTSLLIRPYTSCWSDKHGGVCYDGRPPQPPPSLGEIFGTVTLSFAANAWRFSVTATDSAGNHTKIRLIPAGDREWRLALKDLPQGRYHLDIFGNGHQGDVAAAAAITLRAHG